MARMLETDYEPRYKPLPVPITVVPNPTSSTVVVYSAPVPTPPPEPVKVIQRSEPPPGFTWVDATPDVPGHWQRLRAGQSPQGAPIEMGPTPEIIVRDHREDPKATLDAVIHRQIPIFVHGIGDHSDHNYNRNRFLAAGGTEDEFQRMWHSPQNTYENAPKWDTVKYSGDEVQQGIAKGDTIVVLKPEEALRAKEAKLSPEEWYYKRWVIAVRGIIAEEVQKAEEEKAKEEQAKELPPLPITPLSIKPPQPVRKDPMNAALIAAGVGLGIYLLLQLS